jgi:hypothetical protein
MRLGAGRKLVSRRIRRAARLEEKRMEDHSDKLETITHFPRDRGYGVKEVGE